MLWSSLRAGSKHSKWVCENVGQDSDPSYGRVTAKNTRTSIGPWQRGKLMLGELGSIHTSGYHYNPSISISLKKKALELINVKPTSTWAPFDDSESRIDSCEREQLWLARLAGEIVIR